MNKHFTLLLALVAVSFSFGQSFIIPHKVVTGVSVTGIGADFHAYIKNNTGGNLTMSWTSVPGHTFSGWSYNTCDNKDCYPGFPSDVKTMNPILVNDSGDIKITVDPQGMTGTATVKFAVWETSNPSLKDTITFIITASAVGLENSLNANGFSIYPNPSKNFVNVHFPGNGGSVKIFSVNGRQLLEQVSNGTEASVDVSALPAGLYMIECKDQNGARIFRKITVQ